MTVAPVRAVVFDVDGTLYHQAPIRALMAAELAACAAIGRIPARRAAKALATFRRVREELRDRPSNGAALDSLQYDLPAERLGESPAFIRSLVEEWMHRRPLKYLRAARRRSVAALVHELASQGVALGVFSDYPAEDKLAALGLAPYFTAVVCATDREVNAFKPQPRGFLLACRALGVDPRRAAYVGDRAEVDAAGALAAGMRAYLVDEARPAPGRDRKDEAYGSSGLAELGRLCRPAA